MNPSATWYVHVNAYFSVDGFLSCCVLQVSAPLPLFQLFRIPSMFYCHFPDKLLCTERRGLLKTMYRYLIDNFEESSTGCANEIVVNSLFTAKVFADNFQQLGKLCKPQVLYPTIELPDVESPGRVRVPSEVAYIDGYDYVFVSLNRYERKKNIGLAIHAFHLLLEDVKALRDISGEYTNKSKTLPRVLLVVAGGYDDRVAENVEHHRELQALAAGCGENVATNVVFRQSISDAERNALLTCATAILYTPANEHFGIVPLEAMSRQTPVIAVKSGGPLETVVHGITGFLCDETPATFSAAMFQFIVDSGLSVTMGEQGRKHTQETFTFDAMVPQLEVCLQKAARTQAGGVNSHQHDREDKFLSQLIVSFGVVFALVTALLLGLVLSVNHFKF